MTGITFIRTLFIYPSIHLTRMKSSLGLLESARRCAGSAPVVIGVYADLVQSERETKTEISRQTNKEGGIHAFILV